MENTNTAITVAITAISTEHTTLTGQLTTLDEKYKAERLEIVSQLTPLAKALEALTGKGKERPAGSNGEKTRRPMSQEGKDNIRKALEARKLRLAGETPSETPSLPSQGAEEQSEPKSEATPTVKTTELEKDVLLGGIYLNNFQDGSKGEASIWVDQIIANGATKKVTPKQLPGVVASLSKKGLISTDGEGINLTATGLEIAKGLADAK